MSSMPHFKTLISQSGVTDEVLAHPYSGKGTAKEPFLVEWLPRDPRDPMQMAPAKKWVIAVTMAFATLAITFASTAFSGGIEQIQQDLQVNIEEATLSVSLVVLGFALGPMLWGPLSELYGRQIMWVITIGLCTVFGAGSCGSRNITTLLILRFLVGATGASVVVNGAGVIADIFSPRERGLGILVWAAAPFLGPSLGPICGGWLAANVGGPFSVKMELLSGLTQAKAGWRWIDGLTTTFSGVFWVLGTLVVPETYAPVLLRRRAKALSRQTGEVYVSRIEAEVGRRSVKEVFSTTLKRPWVILAKEPIASILAVYSAIVYGTLYLIFSAFPIAFRTERGWSQGISSLSFVGILVGQLIAMVFSVWLDRRYRAWLLKHDGVAPPEQRLTPCLVGAIAMPVGLFWFAFTTYPSVPWIVSIIGSAFFGFGQVLVFLAVINYIVDSYTLYAASALAANAILRALFGFAFPLFTTQMYQNLGVQWASSIPAFLALACVPAPFLFYKYGPAIRKRCPYAAESGKIIDAMNAQKQARSEVKAEAETKPDDASA